MRIRTLTGAALLALAATAVSTQPASAAGTAYHLDCAAGNDANTGTSPGAAWRTLGKVNGRTFGAGDQLLILRGTTCTGALTPKGSGSTGSPVTVDAYGTGARPVIAGAGVEAAVRLYNQQWWEVRNLEITNKGATVGRRRGVSVELADYGTASHIVLENLDIHDVNGEDKKDLGGSGGIYFAISGTTTQTLFDGLTIRNNTVNKVDRAGIFMVSTWNRSGFEANPAGIFRPWPNVVVSGNRLGDLGGDGIVAGNTTGALIERNYVNGFQKRSAGYNAGMWAYDADYAVFQYNEATGGQTTRDGMAYDVDQGTIGTVFQYNYSHDNAGGFMLLCNASGIVRDAVVRYNLSQNDAHRGVETCSAGGIESADVYNNTIHVGPGVSQTVVNDNNTTRRNVRFRNNVVVKTGSGSASFSSLGAGYVLDHNVLVNVTGAPAGAGSTADPRLSGAGTATDLDHADGYRLCAGSPALGTGALIGANGGRDYYGNPVSGTAAPNVGAHGGPGVTCSAGPVTSGGTYEVALSGTGQALDVPGGATAPGTRLIVWAWHGGDNQRWTFTANGDGSYAIRNVKSGLCVDVDGAGTAAGAAVLQWTCTGTANQRWQISAAAGGGYTVTARHSGLVLGAVATGNGSAVTQQTGAGAATQRWAFTG
ncbi:RICIN domain-containing protein [Longispora sp. NPDC051575]|uniref:RICIN domain-containing protein n=1 Tax=Longispora sp. NPDC051575 TaxID=3154943 RepID=UPI003415BB15